MGTVTEKPLASAARPAAKRPRRRWLPYLGALLLIAGIVAGLWPQPVPVEIARVTTGALRATVNEEGKTRIKQRYVISAPVTGLTRRIRFKAGAEVKAGETLLAMVDAQNPAPLDVRQREMALARRDAERANVQKARAAHDYAARELKRVEDLYQHQTVSIQELDAARMREATSAQDIASAEGILHQVEAGMVDYSAPNNSEMNPARTPMELKSPVTGRVLRVMEENARLVNAGTPLLEVGDPTDLEVVIEVLSRDGALIKPGTKVELEQWGGGEPLLARVRLVEPAAFTKVSALGVEEQRVNVIADLVTPPSERPTVGDQFRVEARIIVWEESQVLKVQNGALFRRGEQWAAFVIADGRAQLRPIKTGRTSGTETQILEGLKEGDELILYPGDRVHEGLRVRKIRF